MIKITVELIPNGDVTRTELLGIAIIANTGRGTATTGQYRWALSKRGSQAKQTWRDGEMIGFPRKRLGTWDLLFRVLREAVGTRNPP